MHFPNDPVHVQALFITAVTVAILAALQLASVTCEDTLTVLPNVGVQFASRPLFGAMTTHLLEWSQVGPLIVNEVCPAH